MNGYEKRRDDKKRAILQIAMQLFTQYGFDRVTIMEIAEKAHVSKVSIYNFYESKENLRRLIIKDILDGELAKLDALFKQDIGVKEKIEAYTKFRIAQINMDSHQLLFEATESDSEIKEYFNKYTDAHRQILMEFIEEGQSNGVFSTKISKAAIAIYIDIYLSYCENSSRNRKTINLLKNDGDLSEELNMLFWDGFIRNGD